MKNVYLDIDLQFVEDIDRSAGNRLSGLCRCLSRNLVLKTLTIFVMLSEDQADDFVSDNSRLETVVTEGFRTYSIHPGPNPIAEAIRQIVVAKHFEFYVFVEPDHAKDGLSYSGVTES